MNKKADGTGEKQQPKKSIFVSINNGLDIAYDGFIKFINQWGFLIIALIITALAMTLRIAFFDRNNGDIYWYQIPWVTWYREGSHNGINSFAEMPISFYNCHGDSTPYSGWSQYLSDCNNGLVSSVTYCDYLMGYLNLLALFSYLPVDAMYVCKIIAICSDLIAALGIAMLAWKLTKGDKLYTLICYCLYLVLPTIFINSGVWGQCDGLYACLIIWCIYFTITKKPWFAMMFLGFALATKLQAVFIIPVFAFLWLRKEFKLRWVLIIPIAMLLMMIPAYIAGMDFLMPWKQYFSQVGSYKGANYNSGSFYVIFTGIDVSAYVNWFGIPLCLIAIILALFIIWRMKIKVTPISTLAVAALFAILVPFFLPHMHERYFYLADVFVFIYCMLRKKRYWLIPLMQFSSFNAYTIFLFGSSNVIIPTIGIRVLYISMFLNFIIMSVIFWDILKMEKEAPVLTVYESDHHKKMAD
ncbi:MAG: glycosyltransferase 87 family protein [Bacilli bacterium]|jgi:Gpi18-like mannosyltransferase